MQRIQSVEPKTAQGLAKELLDAVEAAFGMVPNATRVMANSPAVLEGFLGLSAALGKAKIGPKLHNQVKLATSETNACDYCTSILTAVAPQAGLSAADVLTGRTRHSEDRRTKAALALAHDVLETRGKVSNQRIAAVREAGFGDAQIVEIVASVVLGCFTNFLNNAAQTELDIPKAQPVQAALAATCGTEACAAQ